MRPGKRLQQLKKLIFPKTERLNVTISSHQRCVWRMCEDWSQETCQRWPQTLGLGNGNIDMNQRPVVILMQYIPVEVVVSGGGSSVVVGRCAASTLVAS